MLLLKTPIGRARHRDETRPDPPECHISAMIFINRVILRYWPSHNRRLTVLRCSTYNANAFSASLSNKRFLPSSLGPSSVAAFFFGWIQPTS